MVEDGVAEEGVAEEGVERVGREGGGGGGVAYHAALLAEHARPPVSRLAAERLDGLEGRHLRLVAPKRRAETQREDGDVHVALLVQNAAPEVRGLQESMHEHRKEQHEPKRAEDEGEEREAALAAVAHLRAWVERFVRAEPLGRDAALAGVRFLVGRPVFAAVELPLGSTRQPEARPEEE